MKKHRGIKSTRLIFSAYAHRWTKLLRREIIVQSTQCSLITQNKFLKHKEIKTLKYADSHTRSKLSAKNSYSR